MLNTRVAKYYYEQTSKIAERMIPKNNEIITISNSLSKQLRNIN